jgi:hypothetical protein
MKINWLYALLAILVISSCRKTEVGPGNPAPENTKTGVSFASLFQSNMVVQRDKPLVI